MKALLIRFGPSCYDDPMEALTRLRQSGSVEDYKTQFESLSLRLRGLSDNYKLSCFLSGLRDDIRLPVRIFNPTSLISAYSLAKIQEENLSLTKKSINPSLPILPKPPYPELSNHHLRTRKTTKNSPYQYKKLAKHK